MVGKFPKEEEVNALRELFRPHIESFDYFIDQGLETALSAIRPIEIRHPETSRKLRIWFGKPELSAPIAEGRFTSRTLIYPQQCRESNSTYKGRFAADVYFQYDGGVAIRENIKFGHIPIMLMSKLCHLRGADPRKLVAHREEATEMGGYFVCNGMERLVRLLILQKSNYPMAMVRKSFVSRGDGYTDTAVSIRCCREDQTSASLRVYYIQNGSARVGFWVGLREILLPVGILLKALVDVSDREIYADLTSIYDEENRKENGAVGTQLAGERAKIILDELRDMSLLTHVQCLQHIGQMLQPVIRRVFDENSVVAGKAVLQEFILVHLGNDHDKYNLLIFMLQKLFAVVDHTATPDNADALQNQEVLTAGLLFTTFLKAKMEGWLNKAKQTIEDELKKPKPDCDFDKPQDIKKLMDKSSSAIGKSVDSMMRTGKLGSINTADLPQREGMTIPAEKLNYLRFLSHFRSVHRGAAFAKMRTTTVRKLLPESWGFLCPVHTPDGTPCGLLNHMTYTCRISSHYDLQGGTKDFLKIRMSILNTLVRMGMVPLLPKLERAAPPEFLSVLLDGCVVGSVASSKIEQAVAHFRKLKLSSPPVIPADLEVGYVPLSFGGAFPGLFLFTGPSRFLRPVRNISVTDTDGNIELIGPFEQAFMEIRCADGGDGGRNDLFPATHAEIHPTRMLSVVANLTPWSDHNQSPRNMYQCQMAKQTMGTYSQAVRFRLDNKAYQLQTPQSPIVRTRAYKEYCLDEFPSGTNAIVAVLAYTGYDMEDAMILNKSSVERGLCRGHIYQTEFIDLEQNRRTKSDISEVFTKSTAIGKTATTDSDGLPLVGQALNPKETLYTTYNRNTGQTRNTDLKGSEPAFIDHVAIDGTGSNINIEEVQKVNIRLRRPRNPVIGDKFSSRHGQKGVCSQLWPDIDMPFSAVTGMRPDLIINPHAFPSRMTIAMLLESIAAKGGSLKGEFVDATPFAASTRESPESDSESDSPVDKLGPLLASYGFNYHGLEVMYSGVFGTELAFEIFIGPVYYQRLRHMVSDKFQVRSTGPIDQITRQPVGGRKRGGGIRFGEMERDAVIAHGAAYLLHDRLHTCSDYHVADVCSLCGSVLTSTTIQKQKRFVIDVPGLPPLVKPPKLTTCLTCKTSKGMETVAMPYVFKYLASELAAMNIKLILNLSKETEN